MFGEVKALQAVLCTICRIRGLIPAPPVLAVSGMSYSFCIDFAISFLSPVHSYGFKMIIFSPGCLSFFGMNIIALSPFTIDGVIIPTSECCRKNVKC